MDKSTIAQLQHEFPDWNVFSVGGEIHMQHRKVQHSVRFTRGTPPSEDSLFMEAQEILQVLEKWENSGL